MKTLKVKTIKSDFNLSPSSSLTLKIEQFDKEVSKFLSTIDATKIYQINYLNSSAGDKDSKLCSVIMAVITYFEE